MVAVRRAFLTVLALGLLPAAEAGSRSSLRAGRPYCLHRARAFSGPRTRLFIRGR